MTALEPTLTDGGQSLSPTARWVRLVSRNPSAQLGMAVLIVLALAALAAPWLTAEDPTLMAPARALQPPSLAHPMGTDHIGRDAWARFLYGGRVSLMVGFLAIGIGASGGITLGVLAGYFGGWIDSAVTWATEVLLAFPDLLMALAILAILGPGLGNAMLAVGVSFMPGFARLTRSSILSLRETSYVEAARALGASTTRIVLGHILPNALRPLMVLITLGLGSAILAGAALSFLGLGIQPPDPEWGALLNAGQKYVRQAWWLTVFPGLGIFLTILALNLLGDALSDAIAGQKA